MRQGPISFLIPPLTLLQLLFQPASFGQDEKGQKPTQQTILSQKVPVEGVLLNSVEAGQGFPLLFLHGLGGSVKDWAANLPPLAASHRVMAIDFPGFGGSEKPEVQYSIEWLTDVVEKFVKMRQLEGINVVGHSMGGLVALNLAARPNSPVKKLIVADAVGIGDKAEFLSYAMTKKIIGPESRWDSLEGVLREEFRSMIEGFIKDQKNRTAREFFESLPKVPLTGQPLLPMTPAVQMTASIIDFDIRPRLSLIRQPTLILWGERDPVAPPKDARFLQKEVPGSTLTLFSHCGHSPMIEQPVRFNQEVNKFLHGSGPGSSK